MRILRIDKLHPYKLRLVQELSDDDFDRREKYADIMMEKYYDPNNPCFAMRLLLF
nr:unnamed protein product [Callosobruchus chinensis]